MSIEAMKLALAALNEAVAFREGGRQKAIDAVKALRAALAQPPDNTACKSVQKRLEAQQPATPERVPMTDEALWTAVIEHLGPEALSGGRMSILDAFHLGITVAEDHHGITAAPTASDA